MARDLTDAAAFLSVTSSLGISAMPITLALWWKPTVTSSGTIAGLSDGTNNNRTYVQRGTAANPGPARAVQTAAGSSAGVSTSGNVATNNSWGHMVGTYASASLRNIFFNGANKTGSGSGLGAMAALNSLYIGASGAGAVSAARGHVAEVAIWKVILTDAQIANLGIDLYSPGLVDPGNLIGYWKLLGNTSPEPNEVAGGPSMTINGTAPQSAHPPGIVYDLTPTADSYLWSKSQVKHYLTASTLFPHLHQDAATTDGEWEANAAVAVPLIMQTSWRWDSSGIATYPGPYVTVNWVGEIFTGAGLQAPVGAITSDAGSDLIIGNDSTLDVGWAGYIGEFMMWRQTLLTSPELNVLYIDEQAFFGSP